MRRARWAVVALLTAMLAAAVVGCSSSDEADQASSEGAQRAGEAVAGAGSDAGDLVAQQGEPVNGPRRIVYTSDLRVRVDRPTSAARETIQIAEAADGELASQSEDVNDDQVRVTVRVPSDRFRRVLDDIAALGEVLERHSDTEDVTDQVVDVEARLANAEASAERLRALFAGAQDVAQVVSIEDALTEREAEVESLTGQLRLLEDRADRSTITATFTREGEPEVDDDIPGFTRGLRNGWVTFLTVLAVGVTALGFLLPFLAVVVPLLLIARFVLRRRRGRISPPPVPSSPGAGQREPPRPPDGAGHPPS